MFWRNIQIKVSPRAFLHELFLKFTELSESMMLWIDFFKNHFDRSKNFINFWFDATEKNNIVNLSRYRSNSDALVVLNCSLLTFLGESEDATFCPSLYYVLVIYEWQNRGNKSNFLDFHTSEGISSRSAAVLFSIFVRATLSSYCVNCPGLMSSCL